ncbi:reverse transcriptase family protein, partial [Pyrenophora tritici-repentis]
GYARESIIEEVIELLSFPEEFELDDIAIEDLLTSRQRRQQQPSHASALPESQMGGEEIEQDKEQYEGGLPTPEPSNLSLHNDQDLISEQQAIDEQLVQEQQRNVVQGSQDISATQIEGYIPDRYKNNAPRRRNLDLSTDNIIEGPRRTRRIADLQEPERWHSHAVTYGGSVDNYLKAFSTALRAEPTTKIHCTQHYGLKCLGELKWFLGIRVVRDINARTIHLVQDAYIDKVAAKYNIISAGRPSEVPMLANYLEQQR